METKIRTRTIFVMLLLLTVVAFVPQVMAKPQYKAALDVAYGRGSCIDCHINPNGGKPLTDYGSKFESQPNYENNSVAVLRTIGAPPVSAVDADTTVTPTATKIPVKSPGIGIVVTIGIICVMYLIRKMK
jgi:hypothetical protein